MDNAANRPDSGPRSRLKMDLLSTVIQLAFFGVFVATLVRFLRRPTRIELALVAIFGSTAAIFVYSLANTAFPGQLTFLQPVVISVLLAQPVLVFWLVTLIRPLPRWVLPVTAIGWLLATAGVVLAPPRFVPGLLFVAIYFMAGEGGAAVLLMRESQRRFGVHRIRLGLAGVATALFGAAIFIAAIGSAASPTGSDSPTLLWSRVSALLAAAGFLAAFLPPGWLRRLGQRAVAFDITRVVMTSPSGTDPEVLWSSLATAARAVLGASSARITGADGQLLATTEPAETEPATTEPATTEPAATEPATTAAAESRTSSDTAASSVDGKTLHGSWIRLTFRSPGQAEARLDAHLDGQPLFIEEDLAVINLLGAMTIRAVEREEAIVRLAEAKRELQAAAAIRASEARFRALLQADPNSVLAVDGAGIISWATGPTAELFGRPAHELAGLPIGDVVQLSTADLAQADDKEDRVRRVEAIARRQDGSTFPADVALTDFELDERVFQLFVVSDATWRHEASLMRERFLGILSHELRTPITAIYGGTQLLLKTTSQLDLDSRAELLANVATEAERLERIIENLLVLARVERGADFFEARPVALRPVLIDLVARERRLWPDLRLELAIEPGLALVAADEEYIGLIVRNLISNAAKYAGPRASVAVTARQEGDEVTVRVSDDGPGIPADEAEQLFDLYYRSSTTSAAPGAGIGLFVCRGLVNALGGSVWARPRPEGGAEFGFSIPIYREPTDVSTARSAPKTAVSART